MLLFCMINLPLTPNSFFKRSNLINLNYEFFNLNELHKSNLKQISSFENSILINKWINNLNKKTENNDNLLIESNYILKSLIDFKVNIAIYKNQKGISFYKYKYNDITLYSILIKEENNTLYIKRIAINSEILSNYNINSNSKMLLFRLLQLKSKKKLNLNFSELHEYDPRFKYSWHI